MDKLIPVLRRLSRGRKLILISNREPYSHEKIHDRITCARSKSGLVSALDPVMQAYSGTWIAWGSGTADLEVGVKVGVPPDHPKYTLKRIRLSEEEVELYYRGFSNQTLWPLFHLFPEKTRFDPRYWEGYRRVNAKFAAAVLREMKPGDLVWVHDFHLSLTPRFIRERMKKARISLFWHIPWVPWEVFRNLPWRRELLEGMLGADLIGFQTRPFAKNFLKCVREVFGLPIKKNTVNFNRREVKVGSFPIGIDYKQFANLPKEVLEHAERIKRIHHGKRILLSIDRLDYTKGILNRLESFERFLEKYPHFRGEVVLMMVATPSRTKVTEYRSMKDQVDRLVGHINSKFRRVDWVPVHYFYRTLSQNELLSFYRAADAALVTPLMDGMNLISKEYIATSENGVIILSEFAGAAERLKKAILVNPFDTDKLAGAIKSALKMSREERKRRSKYLKQRVKKFDVYWWARKFFEEWNKCYQK